MFNRFAPIMVAIVLLLLSAGCSLGTAPTKTKLVVAIQPTLAATEMLEKAKPLEQYLEQKLGNDIDVEIYVPLSQAGVIEALRFGQAQVAFMSAWPSYLAVEKAGAELALAEVREVLVDNQKTNATYYFSYWVTAKDSPYQTLADLRNKRACFPSPISTSGYVAPLGRLIELGLLAKLQNNEVDPKSFFSDVRFGGGYAQCWEALKAGQVDVSIIAGDVPEKLYNEVLAGTKTLEKQGPIPSHGVLLSKELKEPLRSRVTEAIASLGAVEHRDLMRSFISSIFMGFEKTNAEAHLGTLKGYLQQAGLVFTERISP
ncbi:MAG: phosphate/phosphite/phosphonate ABC transporter substrate-binding protein [Chloroflexi bacterium]|nr:phosphate/phosphite/phosphonate ABC transporter substrate-binding protein [Chloroflexota bacterium]